MWTSFGAFGMASFTYQCDYFTPKLMSFLEEGAASAAWLRSLSEHLSRFFLEAADRIQAGRATNTQ
jgi:hypothetical protein